MKQAAARAASPDRRPAAVRFAAALLERHGLHRHPRGGAEGVLRRTARACRVHCSQQWFSLRIAPLVRLTLSEWSAAAVDSRAWSGAEATPRAALHTTVYRTMEHLVQRLTHAAVQLSAHPAALATARVRVREAREFEHAPRAVGGAASERQAVARVLRAPPATTPAVTAAPIAAAPATTVMQRRFEIDRNERPAKRPEAPLDLVRLRHELTREVVRTLDRRVTAHRERMGRT